MDVICSSGMLLVLLYAWSGSIVLKRLVEGLGHPCPPHDTLFPQWLSHGLLWPVPLMWPTRAFGNAAACFRDSFGFPASADLTPVTDF